jgi:hypothetical protein
MFEKELLEIRALPPEERERVLDGLLLLVTTLLEDRAACWEAVSELAKWLN